MIFNPVRSGSEKEYEIKALKDNITPSATRLKPGHIFKVSTPSTTNKSLKMEFTDPDTGKSVTLQGVREALFGPYTFVMPAADVTVTY